jgi:hypothetical protein
MPAQQAVEKALKALLVLRGVQGGRMSRTLIRIRLPTLVADASGRAALLVAYIRPVCAVLAPCRAGA